MKNKLILLIVVLTTTIPLLSVSQYACEFLFINPSARDAAFGLESGVASLHQLSAASIANNPAKLGAFNGVGFEYSSYDCVFGSYNTSNIVISKNGFGISLPLLNQWGRFGNSRVYSTQSNTDEDGNAYGSFRPTETNASISIGADLTKMLSKFNINFFPRNKDLELDLFSGYSYNIIKSSLTDSYSGESEINDINEYGFTADYGIIGRFGIRRNGYSLHSCEFTAGINFTNMYESEMYYINKNQKDPFPAATKFGATGAYYLALPWLQENLPQFYSSYLNQITNNALVVYGSIDHAEYSNVRAITGYGLEVSFLDIISTRIGHTINHETELSGTSYSFGLNLNYHNRYQLMIDYLDMFESTNIYSPEKWNFSVAYKF